ncbi:MAG: RDD family protein, partial [Nitrospinota bacterium]|nr:RDD family protein [Nitrospinota bacterium]
YILSCIIQHFDQSRALEWGWMAKYRIVTPERVDFHYTTAGLASRAMAWLLDQLFLNFVRAAIFFMFISYMKLGAVVIILMFFVLDFFYFLYFELYWAGQSPGKKYMGIRVIAASGGRLGFNETFMRNLIRNIDNLPVLMTLGAIVAALDPYGRRLGDFAADTLVVVDAHRPIPSESVVTRGRVNTYMQDPVLKNRILSRATREERNFVFDLTSRRDELEPEAREELFRRASAMLREKYNLPKDMEYLSDEQAVLNIALTLESAKIT